MYSQCLDVLQGEERPVSQRLDLIVVKGPAGKEDVSLTDEAMPNQVKEPFDYKALLIIKLLIIKLLQTHRNSNVKRIHLDFLIYQSKCHSNCVIPKFSILFYFINITNTLLFMYER